VRVRWNNPASVCGRVKVGPSRTALALPAVGGRATAIRPSRPTLDSLERMWRRREARVSSRLQLLDFGRAITRLERKSTAVHTTVDRPRRR
jgi:hypothetical protein